ncbi:hypothetical protein EGI32_08555 [Ferruginibacter sp. HRS2-29]|nr:hypothetical protein [Ferruginibacter sp. HRS2-29]
MYINGIEVGDSTVFVTSTAALQATGTKSVRNPVNDLTGTITVLIKLYDHEAAYPNGNAGGTFRMDDFILNGYVNDNGASTGSGVQYANKGGYRYGFNGQEKSDEIKGEGNSNTALYWEFDTRIGRRFNLDPKPNISISPYATFENNPILYNDILGDSIPVRFQNRDNTGDDNAIPDLVQKMYNKEYGIKVGYNAKTQMLYYDGDVETDEKVSQSARSMLIAHLSSTDSKEKSMRKFGDIVFGYTGIKTTNGNEVSASHGMAGTNFIRILGRGSRHTLFVNMDAYNDDLTLKEWDYSGLTSRGFSKRTFNMARMYEHEYFGHGIKRKQDPSREGFTAGKVEFLPNLFRTEMGLPKRSNYGINTGKGLVILFGIDAKEVRKINFNYSLVPTAPYIIHSIIK